MQYNTIESYTNTMLVAQYHMLARLLTSLHYQRNHLSRKQKTQKVVSEIELETVRKEMSRRDIPARDLEYKF